MRWIDVFFGLPTLNGKTSIGKGDQLNTKKLKSKMMIEVDFLACNSEIIDFRACMSSNTDSEDVPQVFGNAIHDGADEIQHETITRIYKYK